MHAKREIPVSSCPEYVDNILYSTGGSTDDIDRDEDERFNLMLDKLDNKAKQYKVNKKPKGQTESKQHKRMRLGIHGGEWCIVDTENKFWYKNEQYVIDDQAVQYAPVETQYGQYYAMDKILVTGGKFYDMNFDEVKVHRLGGIVPYEAFMISGH